LDVLDCLAVTFYEFTILDLFLLYCNDESFQNRDDLWKVAKVLTQASVNDHTTAATCQNFVVYGSALSVNATDTSVSRATNLLCDCFEGLEEVAASNDYTIWDYSIYWDEFVPEEFAIGVIEMLDYLELFPNAMADVSVGDCDFVTEDSIFLGLFSDSLIKAKTTIRLDAALETDSVDYTKLNICVGFLLALLTVSNAFMCLNSSDGRSKITSIMAL